MKCSEVVKCSAVEGLSPSQTIHYYLEAKTIQVKDFGCWCLVSLLPPLLQLLLLSYFFLLPHSPPPPHTYSSHSVVHSDHSQIQSGDSFTVSRILRLEMDFVALTLILPTPKITLPWSIESVLLDP